VGSNANTGLSVDVPLATIAQALTLCAAGDTIVFMDGTYTYSTTVEITKGVTITSQNGKAVTTVVKSTAGNLFTIRASNVSIKNITLKSLATNTADAVIGISRETDGTAVPVLYSNIVITGNNIQVWKYGVSVNGDNLTITNNNFSRTPGSTGGSMSIFLVYCIRNSVNLSNNTHTDNSTSRFVYLTSAGTAASTYLDRANSKGGNLLLNNNVLSCATTTRNVQFCIQDYFNTYTYGTVGQDAQYSASTKLTITIKNNNVNTGSATYVTEMLVPYLTSSTCLNMYNSVNIASNTISNGNVGMVKMDAPASTTLDTSVVQRTYVFYINDNTITKYELRADYTGDQAFVQQTARIFPSNLVALANSQFIQTTAIPVITNQTTGTSNYSSPVLANVSFAIGNSNIASLSVVVPTNTYASSSGLSYLTNGVQPGCIGNIQIVALDDSNVPITDFSANPVSLVLSLPMANPNNILKLFKLDSNTLTLLTPQPANYPVPLTYNATTTKWEGFLTSLSNYTILDQNYVETPLTITCFKEDTQLLTDVGYVPIQMLRRGDRLQTHLHGYVAIHDIGYKEIIHPAKLNDRISNQLYVCQPRDFPEMECHLGDVILTGCHCLLENNFSGDAQRSRTLDINGNIYVTDDKYRIPACAHDKTSVYSSPGKYMIYHVALENDEPTKNYGVYAHGLLVETCSIRYLHQFSKMSIL
jgi:hypothetical protein